MDSQQMTGARGDIAEQGLRYTKEQWDQVLTQTEDFVRSNPTRALLYGVGAGFILDRLPIFRIFGTLVRLLLFALKPALLIYGASKVYQMAKEPE
jgi:hypothetical protein